LWDVISLLIKQLETVCKQVGRSVQYVRSHLDCAAKWEHCIGRLALDRKAKGGVQAEVCKQIGTVVSL